MGLEEIIYLLIVYLAQKDMTRCFLTKNIVYNNFDLFFPI